MEKTYRLIKEYPESPKLGTVITQNETYINLSHFPENWEEVIEIKKDYEILSFRDKKNHSYFGINIFTDCKTEESLNIYLLYLKSNKVEIYSVKRLSDGEIFTIGDNIQHYQDSRDNGIINKFEIQSKTDILLVNFIGDRKENNNIIKDYKYCNSIDVVNHFKKPLFKTEDGVDIYEDSKGPLKYDIFPTVDIITYDLSHCSMRSPIASYRDQYNDIKIFSTLEKAQEYIDLNKPKYSFNDICGAIDQSCHLGPNYEKFIEKLEELNRK